MVRELESTLLINDEVYNINANKANTADEAENANKANTAAEANKVKNALILTKTQLNKTATDVLTFNGSEEKTLNIVPASGGRFSGRITVPGGVTDATLSTDGDTVLNYTDIKAKIIDKLNNPGAVAKWDGENEKLSFSGDTAIYSTRVVVGPSKNDAILKFAQYNLDNKKFSDFLYISTDTWNIWFGGFAYFNEIDGKNTAYVKRLAITTETAKAAETAETAKSAEAAETAYYLVKSEDTDKRYEYADLKKIIDVIESLGLIPADGNERVQILNKIVTGAEAFYDSDSDTVLVANANNANKAKEADKLAVTTDNNVINVGSNIKIMSKDKGLPTTATNGDIVILY